MADDDSNPTPPVSLKPVTDAIGRLNKIVYSNALEAGEISPVELLQRAKVAAIEIKTIREFMLDYLAGIENGEVNMELRHLLSQDYFTRLAYEIEAEARKLDKGGPKIDLSAVNGKSRG